MYFLKYLHNYFITFALLICLNIFACVSGQLDYGYEYRGCGRDDVVITPTCEQALIALLRTLADHTPLLLNGKITLIFYLMSKITLYFILMLKLHSPFILWPRLLVCLDPFKFKIHSFLLNEWMRPALIVALAVKCT